MSASPLQAAPGALSVRTTGWLLAAVTAIYAWLVVTAPIDAMQGAILGIKLNRLEAWNQRRRELAQRYDDAFADHELECPVVAPGRALMGGPLATPS